MDPSTIRTLIDHNEWATARLLTAAAQLDADELRRARPGAGHGSIWGQLHHIALSQIGLYLACLGKVDSPMRARQVIAESGRFDLETPGGLWRAFDGAPYAKAETPTLPSGCRDQSSTVLSLSHLRGSLTERWRRNVSVDFDRFTS